MIKSILKWVLKIILTIGTIYYVVAKIFHWDNLYVLAIDNLFAIIGVVFSFIIAHWWTVLVIIGLIGFFIWLYYYITHKFNNRF